MRKINGIENVDNVAFYCSPEEQQKECDRQAGLACRDTVAKFVQMLPAGAVVRCHGNRRIYQAAMMVGTEDEYNQALKESEKHGQWFGERVGTMNGLMAGRAEGHRSGQHAAEAAFRRLPLWRKVYHHFAGVLMECPLCKGNHSLAGCPRWRAK